MSDAPGIPLRLSPTPGDPGVWIPGPRAEVGVASDGTVHAGASLPPGVRPWLSLVWTPQGYAVRTHSETLCEGRPLPSPATVAPGQTLAAGAARVQLLAASPPGPPRQFTPPPSRETPSPKQATPPSPAAPPLSATIELPACGTFFGPYRLDAILGQGGHGVVYRAWDARLQRPVALKVLLRGTARARERFLREARALAALHHPAIVKVHDLGEQDGLAFVVTEFIEGQSLEERGVEVSDPRAAAALIRDVALAAHHAHSQQIVHRDIKPSNVLIDRAGSAFLVDFGIASLQATGSDPGLTAAGAPIGTPEFMAPEQARGRADPRSDVFGLGATLLWVLTGHAPGSGQGWKDLPATRALPSELRALLSGALALVPEKRTPDAAALAAALDAVSRGEPSRRRRALLALAALTVAALCAGGVAFAARGPSADPASAEGADVPAPADELAALEARAAELEWPETQPQLERLAGALRAEPALLARVEALRDTLHWRDLRDRMLHLDREAAPLNEVLEALSQAQALRPDEAETGPRAQLALLLRRGAGAEALRLIESLEPTPWTRWATLQALALRGDLEGALAVCERLRADPEPWPAVARGARADLLGVGELAVEAAEEALAADPDAVPALHLLARGALACGDPARTLELVAKLADPRDPRPELLRALALRRDTKVSARRTCLARAAQLWGERAPLELALLRLELELEAGGDVAGAAEVLRTSRDPRALLLRGAALAEEDPPTARQLWAQAYASDAFAVEGALEATPWLPAATIREAGGVSAPRRAVLAAGSLPRYGEAAAAGPSLRRALELAARGASWAEVEAALTESLSAAPLDPGVARCVAELQVGRDRYASASDAIERALELGADRGWAAYLHAELANRRGRVARSIQRFEQLAASGKEPWRGLAAAEAAWLRGDPQTADAGFRRVLADSPDDRRALLGRAVCAVLLGEFGRAQALSDALLAACGACDTRALMVRALADTQRLTAEAPLDARLAALGRFEQLRRLSAGSSPRQIAARVALAHADTRPWAERLLNEARAYEPERAPTWVLLGRLELARPEPAQARVLAFWREAQALDPDLVLEPAFAHAYREAFGEAPDLRAQ